MKACCVVLRFGKILCPCKQGTFVTERYKAVDVRVKEEWKIKAVCFNMELSYHSRTVRLPEFLDNRHMKAVRLSALRTGRLYPSRRYPWYSFLLEAESTQDHSSLCPLKLLSSEFATATHFVLASICGSLYQLSPICTYVVITSKNVDWYSIVLPQLDSSSITSYMRESFYTEAIQNCINQKAQLGLRTNSLYKGTHSSDASVLSAGAFKTNPTLIVSASVGITVYA